MTTDQPIPFPLKPLLTPERIASDPQEAFRVTPDWVRSLTFVTPEGEPDKHPFKPILDVSPVAVVGFGKTVVSYKTLSLLGLAVAFEITRVPGVSIATDTNGSGRYYERVTIAGHGEDLTTLSRVLYGATGGEQIKANGCQSELRPEHLRAIPARKPSKDARETLLSHLQRVAQTWEERGAMPPHLTSEAYLENVRRLFDLSDLEATGLDPLAILQGPQRPSMKEVA